MNRLKGGPRDLDKRMKSKGLQRLRWFCQPCEKQCRDENAFKQHCLSESHVRRLQLVGDNASNYLNQYTREFQSDFIKLLRTSHGEKPIELNRFYGEFISDKLHRHLNATRFHSLTEFAKFLGREGICRISEDENGRLLIAWIDNSPEALRKQEAIRKRDRMDRNEEQREQEEIKFQVARAQEAAASRDIQQDAQTLETPIAPEKPPSFKIPTTLQKENIKPKKSIFSALKRRREEPDGSTGSVKKKKGAMVSD